VTHPAVLEILSRFGGPAGIRGTSRRKLSSIATRYAPRMGAKLVENILAALDEQTVAVPDWRNGTLACQPRLLRQETSRREETQPPSSASPDAMLRDQALYQAPACRAA
jgi:hypothetical protein